MAAVSFEKYHGTGNDFILIDARHADAVFSREEIARFCHRRLGIGADGLMLMLDSADADFEMKYYNADGREGTMCGNGGRCISAFAADVGIVGPEVRFEAIDGVHRAVIGPATAGIREVKVSLMDVKQVTEMDQSSFVLNTGSPHLVKFVDDLDAVDVYGEGKRIRWSGQFQPEGINVNFVQKNGQRITVKTFERGVEDITLSCGTGVTASAIAASARMNDGPLTWEIHTQGGNLFVTFEKQKGHYLDIWLKGPAERVFGGRLER